MSQKRSSDNLGANLPPKKRNLGNQKVPALLTLKFMPQAVLKLLESMPQPWEPQKHVNCITHSSGMLTIVDNNERTDYSDFMSLWGQAWTQMRDEKRDRVNFRRVRVPCFDDEEPIYNFAKLASLVPNAPEGINVLDRTTMFDKMVDSQPFILNKQPPLGFSTECLLNSKAINVPIPNGPEFNLPEPPKEPSLNPLDHPLRVIYRPRQSPVRVEARVIFSDLYENKRSFNTPKYSQPASQVITRKDYKQAFFTDNSINPIEPALPLKRQLTNVKPFLASFECDSELVAKELACFNASYPFNTNPKKTSKFEPSLIKPFYKNRRPLRSMPSKTRKSYQKLVKSDLKLVLKKRVAKHTKSSTPNLLKVLKSTQFFTQSRIEWLEAALNLCEQGHRALTLLMHKRGLTFMHLDFNFNLKALRSLSTKERKRSRFGVAFHLVRELLKLVKLVTDVHVQFRLKNIDTFQLADALQYIFNHMGQLSGIYRYKYRTMHQIVKCQDLKHVVYDRFNMHGVGKGPGCGFWHASWRVWLFYLRGIAPLLEKWLSNLLVRQTSGRVNKGVAKKVTKQRIESHYDLELRASVVQDILDAMPPALRKSKTVVIMQHLSEAWRCWKASLKWDPEGIPPPIKQLIVKYIELRGANWLRVTKINRLRIANGKVRDKSQVKKNSGRMCRFYMQQEQQRQLSYAQKGPNLSPKDGITLYKSYAEFVRETSVQRIGFPTAEYINDTKLLNLALESLRDEYGLPEKLSNSEREELEVIESALSNPLETLGKIKKNLLSQRVFKDVKIELRDSHSKLIPVYTIDIHERIQDAYLDQYLWHESSTSFWPKWMQTGDNEVPPKMMKSFLTQLNSNGLWDTTSVLLHADISKVLDTADLTLVNKLLRLVVDANLADYMTAKMNMVLDYKDMSHVHRVGLIKGLKFSSFIAQIYFTLTDLLILGLPRALDLHKGFGIKFHPIKFYYRFNSQVYIVMQLNDEECEDIQLNIDSCLNYPQRQCWPLDMKMLLTRKTTRIGGGLMHEFNCRTAVLGPLEWVDCSVSNASNRALHFEFLNFEIRLVPKHLTELGERCWPLTDPTTNKIVTYAFLMVSQQAVSEFNTRIRQIAMSAGTTSFQITAKRWNSAVTALIAYFREAILDTPQLLRVLEKCEARIQNVIKSSLNSKMPQRFPPCVFYSPEELGGLGMLCTSKIEIPPEDTPPNNTKLNEIPQIFTFFRNWLEESADSDAAWLEFNQIRREADQNETKLVFEDVEHLLNRGLPRISTFFQRDKPTLRVNNGFRLRAVYKQYNSSPNPFWFVNFKHDGRIWDLSEYKTCVVKSLGGVPSILNHTLFKATGFTDWEGLLWQRQSQFEQQMALQRLTNAQKQGLSQIPNRRFTLWWSPTINRGNIFIGFLVQLDLTGIFLHGKIPTLKISYIQLFRAHLWQKIHESLVMDLCKVIDKETPVLALSGVNKLQVHPRKSYKMHASAADINLMPSNEFFIVSDPQSLNDDFEFQTTAQTTKSFWVDVQLRFGDFDAHDTAKYAKSKYLDYTTDGVSLYDHKYGVVVAVDLAYNSVSAFGRWIPGLQQLFRAALPLILQSNPGLYVFRERVRKALQLYATEPRKPLTLNEFPEFTNQKSLVIDDQLVYRIESHATENGNTAHSTLNGVLFALDTTNGTLNCIFIDPKKEWAGQKRLSAVSKWTSAEKITAFLKAANDLPNQLIISGRGLKDPIEVNMLEFPEIKVQLSDVSLPLNAIISASPQLSANLTSIKSSHLALNLYDNWLNFSQPSTCLSRLALLLRALDLNAQRTLNLLQRYPANPTFIWPAIEPSEWVELEELLNQLIIAEYSSANGISAATLTQTEIRHLVLGSKPNDQEPTNFNTSEPTNLVAQTVKTHNVHGNAMTVTTTSNYEQQRFDSTSSWRSRALKCSNLSLKAQTLTSVVKPSATKGYTGSKQLITEFIKLCDCTNVCLGVVLGHKSNVESIALIPQIGTATNISFRMPEFASNLEILGTLRTKQTSSLDPLDLMIAAQIRGPVFSINTNNMQLTVFEPLNTGYEWASQQKGMSTTTANFSDQMATTQSMELQNTQGYFYVPNDGIWNYSFLPTLWSAQLPTTMKIALPKPYFDGIHRPRHFQTFSKLETHI